MKSPEILSNPTALKTGDELLGLIISSYNKYRQNGLAPNAMPITTNNGVADTVKNRLSITEAENQLRERQFIAAMSSDRPNAWNHAYKEVLEFLQDHSDSPVAAESLLDERPFSYYKNVETIGTYTYSAHSLQGFVAVKFAYLSFLTINGTPGADLPRYGINTFNDYDGDGQMKPMVKLAIG